MTSQEDELRRAELEAELAALDAKETTRTSEGYSRNERVASVNREALAQHYSGVEDEDVAMICAPDLDLTAARAAAEDLGIGKTADLRHPGGSR